MSKAKTDDETTTEGEPETKPGDEVGEFVTTTKTKDYMGQALANIATAAVDYMGRACIVSDRDYMARALVT